MVLSFFLSRTSQAKTNDPKEWILPQTRRESRCWKAVHSEIEGKVWWAVPTIKHYSRWTQKGQLWLWCLCYNNTALFQAGKCKGHFTYFTKVLCLYTSRLPKFIPQSLKLCYWNKENAVSLQQLLWRPYSSLMPCIWKSKVRNLEEEEWWLKHLSQAQRGFRMFIGVKQMQKLRSPPPWLLQLEWKV